MQPVSYFLNCLPPLCFMPIDLHLAYSGSQHSTVYMSKPNCNNNIRHICLCITEPKHEVQTSHLELNTYQLFKGC